MIILFFNSDNSDCDGKYIDIIALRFVILLRAADMVLLLPELLDGTYIFVDISNIFSLNFLL